MKITTEKIAKIAIVATLYVGATLAVTPLSFGAVQLRFSEILVLLCFYNPMYCISLILGCFVANLYSPMVHLDLIFGVASTVFTVLFIALFGKYKIFGKLSLLVSSFFATISMVLG